MLKTLLASLLDQVIHNTLPASSNTVYHDVPPEQWVDFVVPFDGIAVMGSETTGCEALNVYCGSCHSIIPTLNNAYGYTWIPIKKGETIAAYCNGSISTQLTLIPNIQSSL